MSTRTTLILSLFLVAAAALFSLSVYSRLPEPIVSHWGVDDLPDGSMPRAWGAFLMPVVTTALVALLLALPAIDPFKANLAEFRGPLNLLILLLVLFMTYLHALTLAWNLGFTGFRMSAALLPAMGLLFIFIGALLRRVRRNFFIGIRTPWTLSSDRVWERTHSLGSKLFIASGCLALLGGFAAGPTAFWLVLTPLIGSALFLVAYSYVLYRQESGL
jgi:uncharacterized membrane protein